MPGIVVTVLVIGLVDLIVAVVLVPDKTVCVEDAPCAALEPLVAVEAAADMVASEELV